MRTPPAAPRRATGAARALAAAALLAAIAGGAGCGKLLDIDAPSRVIASTLDDPRNAGLLVTGAIADFECALGLHIVNGGNLGDELADGALNGLYWDVDRRTVHDAGLYGVNTCDDNVPHGLYRPLSVARFQADDARKRLEGWTDAQVPNRTALIATAAAYGGYSLVLMAEAMCSAAIDVGPELTRAQLNAAAEERFTRAIDAARTANRADILNMALVGRARARINQGKGAEAMADARLVPAGFVLNATYSAVSPRRFNPVFTWINRNAALTVEPDFRGLAFGGVADPRVPVASAGRQALDNVTPLWVQNKYGSQAAPIPIARHAEAQLIIAEVAGGQEAVGIINALHRAAGLPPFASTDPAAIRAQVIEERRRELFLEGHHIGDVNRFRLPLTPAAGTQYPPKAGGIYGAVTCFPIPISEKQNNPNIGRSS